MRLWAYLLVLSGLWGSAFPLVRYAVQSMPPLAMAGARAGIAALVLGAVVLLGRQAGRADGRALWHMLVLGTINGWLPNAMTAAALGQVTSAQAALIGASGPLMVVVLAAAALREGALTPRRITGTLLGFAGVAAIMAPLATPGGSVWGGVLMLATAFCYAAGTVYVRWARPGSSVGLVAGQQAFAALPALALALLLQPATAFVQPAPVWAAVAVLGVLASALPMVLFLRMLRTTSASDAALVSYLVPVWATGIAALLLAEWPEPRVLLGGATVLVGVWLASERRPRPDATTGRARPLLQ